MVLITLLGKGRMDKNSVEPRYEKTQYRFPDGSMSQSSVFANAILSNGFYKIDRTIIIGTKSSSWSVLIEEYDKYSDFYIELEEAGNQPDKTQLEKLQNILSERWKMDIQCLSHNDEVKSENSQEILSVYQNCLYALPEDEAILFDFTHGFRTMPLLFLSALRFRDSFRERTNRIEFIYGEFQESISHVRRMNAIWENLNTSKAISSFFRAFEGERLSRMLENEWSEGSVLVKKFSEIIQGNCFIQLIDFVTGQFKNTLSKFKLDKHETWVQPIYEELKYIYNRLNNKTASRILLEMSKLLAERFFYGQAIMALHAATEVFLFEFNGDTNIQSFGDYKKTQPKKPNKPEGEHRCHFYSYCKDHGYKNFKKYFHELEYLRNQIAHGGAQNKKTSKYLLSDNLNNLYNKHYNRIKKMIDELLNKICP